MARVIDAGSGKAEIEVDRYIDNPAFMTDAFSHYLNGMSARAVAVALKPEWPECNERAVQRLAKEHGWNKARAEYIMLRQEAVSTKEGLLPKIVLNLERIRMKFEARTLSGKDLGAYLKLCDLLLIITGQHPQHKGESSFVLSTDKDLQAFLQAIQEDEVLGPVFRKRRKEIQKKYEQNLKAGSAK